MKSMSTADERVPAAPAGVAFRVLLKGIAAGSVLGMAYGVFVLLMSGTTRHVFASAVYGLYSGFMIGLMCTIAALVLHALTARFAPGVRAAAAAAGAAGSVLLTGSPFNSGEEPVFVLPSLLTAAIAAALAVRLTRRLRSMRWRAARSPAA